MKSKTKTLVLLAIAIAIAGVCITCVDQDIRTLGTEANLTALRVESSADITDAASRVAQPIPASVMEDENSSLDQDSTIGWVDIRVANKDTGKITGRLRPIVSRGARAQWGIGTRTIRPDRFEDTRVPATLDSREFIYIRVTSEDGLVTNYYRFDTNLLSWSTNLQYIRIAEREGKAGADIHGHSTGASSWDKLQDKETDPLELSIALKEGENALVTATPFDPKATVAYAVVADGTTAPGKFIPSDQRIPKIEDQDYLYAEVTAENTVDKEYFRFKVSVGRIVNIASLIFDDGSKNEDGSVKGVQVYGLGLPQSQWATVGAGEYQTAKQPSAGFGILLTPDDPDATIVYGRIDNKDAGEPAYTNPEVIKFTNDPKNVPQVLAIKVTSAKGIDTQYYKVRVTNLAATIVKHPKPAWYYQDDIKSQGVFAEGKQPVADLFVELDPKDTGQYTYEWYETDSWYGTYGRHGTSRDEKNNITTVNGGPGQYFYLVQPDEPPVTLEPTGYTAADWDKSPGAWKGGPDPTKYYWADYSRGGEPMAWSTGVTSATYKPRTDWVDDSKNMTFFTDTQNNSFPIHPKPPKVNFLSGATNESRYYWVKVTNKEGLTVTSDRALILTETNPKMDHFIFDLSRLPKKNIKPFVKEGTAYDNVYKIDLKEVAKDGFFPADFETRVNNYQICIAHAQYFLPDGRPWTQNWTHGNLHFGLDDGSLIWWHNNMGANGGSIPLQAPHSSQGGLTVRPDWIGFTPSGDPAKGLPPPINAAGDLPKGIYSMNATDPYPAGVAQGYFAAFIELLELRFQTAPKN